jgi:hypothetical protein
MDVMGNSCEPTFFIAQFMFIFESSNYFSG